MTKLQKKVRAAKKAADRRVAVSLAKYLRQSNPGRKIVGARVRKGKNGTRSITPIFQNAARGVSWAVYDSRGYYLGAVMATGKTTALREAKQKWASAKRVAKHGVQ